MIVKNQLIGAQLENLSADPSPGIKGRVFFNTVSAAAKLDTGASIIPLTPSAYQVPTIQKFLSTGTTTGWLFTISTGTTCAVGDTYTNNAATFTVLAALGGVSGQILFMSGVGPPTASGTLGRATGSGTLSVVFSVATALATYTKPVGCLYLRVTMVGGGGGGGGSANASANAGVGAAGTASVFGANLLFANGGGGGGAAGSSSVGGSGGSANLGTGPIGIALSGGSGSGVTGSATSVPFEGATGAASALGGAGGGGNPGAAGLGGASNTGGGGGGGGGPAGTGYGGAGGGSGGFIDAIVTGLPITYVYAVGAGGAAGAAGTSGNVGGIGGSGLVLVTEYYQ